MLALSLYPLPLISYSHDAAAALLSEREILFAYEEEKASRMPHAIAAVAENAALQAFKQCAVEPAAIDELVLTSMNSCGERADFAGKLAFLRELLLFRDDVNLTCVPHHLAHSALAVLTSPFEKCAFLTMDAGGDEWMGHWGVFADDQFAVRESFELSPAIIYGYLTSLAGFSLFEEGKVMGLSAYGRVHGRLYEWLRANFWIRERAAALEISDRVRLRMWDELRPRKFDIDTPRPHKYHEVTTCFHDAADGEWLSEIEPVDIAATCQRFFEELVLEAAGNVLEATGLTDLAVSGGAFQNVVVNGKLQAIGGARVHVPVAPHDAGLSLGAGLLHTLQRTGRRVGVGASPYLGPSFGSAEVEAAIRSFGLTYEVPSNLPRVVAEELAQGRVVGWFQGRAEFGARALGARSVLADPRDPEAKARVNQALKKRDWFMPYAPSILEEAGAEFFNRFTPSPYMNSAFTVRPGKAHLIPSALHVDGSCRAHSVDARAHPRYQALIAEFQRITGVPLILNTSFNRHGIPIIATPRHAIQHLLEGNVDCLAIEGCFLRGRPREAAAPPPVFGEAFHLGLDALRFAARLVARGRTARANEVVRTLAPRVTATPSGLFSEGCRLWALDEELGMLAARWAELAHAAARV